MTMTSVTRDLGTLFVGGSAAGLSDRQLIERIATRRDEDGEAAFAALVARHGPMVLGVCRQLLGDRHQAEDAFQAVFLVLNEKARSLRDPDLLGKWLYGVAVHTAAMRTPPAQPPSEGRGSGLREADRDGLRRRDGRSDLPRPRAGRGPAPGDRSPARHLSPAGGALLLRGFDPRRGGPTAALARRHRAQPPGPARDKLRRGLTRRGFALSSAAVAAILEPWSARASVSPLLCNSTTRAAIAFAARRGTGRALSAAAA